MAQNHSNVAAVDLGGTNIRAAVVDQDGKLSGFTMRPTDAERGPEAVIARIVETLDASLQATGLRRDDLLAVGIGAPGPLDWKSGVVHQAPNLPGWRDVPLAGRVSAATGLPAFVENDANAAALAEYTYGDHAGSGNMVYITVSTGVGGGLILNGELWHGIYGSAAEVGHMTVDFEGPVHDCGNVGCVEGIAAGPDMADWVAAQIRAGRTSTLSDRVSATDTPSGREVVDAAKAGDALAIDALRRGGRAIGFAIINLTHLLNLELAVVGGGIAHAGELLFDPMRQTVERHVLPSTARDLRIEPWSLGENVGLLGAAASARLRLDQG